MTQDSFINALDTLSLFEPGNTRGNAEEEKFKYVHLVALIKQLIGQGRLMPGQKLPSTRTLAERLKIARNTVLHAYDDLIAQGYCRSHRGIGTFIDFAKGTSELKRGNGEMYEKFLSPLVINLSAKKAAPVSEGFHSDISTGVAPTELLPLHKWRQCSLAAWRSLQRKELALGESRILPEKFENQLAMAISEYVLRTRGITCDPAQIFVFNSALYPVWLIAQFLLTDGDTVAVESPGFPYAREVFRERGCCIETVPIDAEGISIDYLNALEVPPKLIYVTPSHDPTGLTMSLRRRKQLTEFAEMHDCLIIEDDYDNEFDSKYNRLPTLYSTSTDARVLYVANFWKTLFPLVNAGFLILPIGLVHSMKNALRRPDLSFTLWLPVIESITLANFLSEGFLEKHIYKIQQTYARRYRLLVAALTKHLGARILIARESAGMRLSVAFDLPLNDAQIMASAKKAGLPMLPMSPYFDERSSSNGRFLLTFSDLDESVIGAIVDNFSRILTDECNLVTSGFLLPLKKIRSPNSACCRSTYCDPQRQKKQIIHYTF